MTVNSTPLTDIRLVLFDVDGTLTDGGLYYDDHGHELKRFHVRDGFAFKQAMSLGLQIGVITGRESALTTNRMNDLGVKLLIQKCKDKRIAVKELCDRAGVEPWECAFVGDDLIDLPAMRACGYPVAVADAVEEVRAAATYVTQAAGGRGAARELIEHVLKAQHLWETVVERYQ